MLPGEFRNLTKNVPKPLKKDFGLSFAKASTSFSHGESILSKSKGNLRRLALMLGYVCRKSLPKEKRVHQNECFDAPS